MSHDLFVAFALGLSEAEGDVGMTYDGSSTSPRSQAYDLGRALGRLLLGEELED